MDKCCHCGDHVLRRREQRWEKALEEGHSLCRKQEVGVLSPGATHHCLALLSLPPSLTRSPLEAVSKRLAILENRII